jgi:hypothetical protein
MGTFSHLQWDSFISTCRVLSTTAQSIFRHMEVIDGDFFNRVGQMDAGGADICLIHIHRQGF